MTLLNTPQRKEYTKEARITLQIILNLCIPDKELAKTHSQSSFIYFQGHS